ncbi:hypothetical protein [Bradyrhizobium zhanjiangense]|uniref:Uncharacterized protein n=1 Tax=Bradyrhizobium zhanjiangense TaxID=1325107 RepID=A0A4Q0QLL6_9BRAD|nr:hypothetical protein [Bradyrhizobium zhanjiangense]RXG89117.1 hypothetical protein EAS62_31585 [Bradyrhizobium zhanjiangense]RXG95764.1 hypothetical protein EAS61_18080 [Bradyrhizobium zhanjiangense]
MAPRQNACIARHYEDSYRRIQAVGGEALPLNRTNLAHVLSYGDCLVFYNGSVNQIMAFKMGVSVLSRPTKAADPPYSPNYLSLKLAE